MSLKLRLDGLYHNRFRNIKANKIIEPTLLWEIANNKKSEIDELGAFHVLKAEIIELKNEEKFCGLRSYHYVVETGWSENHEGVIYLISTNYKGNRGLTMLETI